MAVGGLRAHEIKKGLARRVRVVSSQQRAGGFHLIARPDDVIAPQISVSLRLAPRQGETGDHAAGKAFALVGFQHGGGDAIEIEAAFLFRRKAASAFSGSCASRRHSVGRCRGKDPEATRGACWPASWSVRPNPSAITASPPHAAKVNCTRQRDVSVLRLGIMPGHLLVGVEILPAVAFPRVTAGPLRPAA